MRVVITDLDHETTDEEQAVAQEFDASLMREHCLTEEELIAKCQDAEGLLVQYAPITRHVMESLPSLSIIGRYGVGVDNVDVEAAKALGIHVTNVPDYGFEEVSDHAIALALSVLRGTARLDRMVRSGSAELERVKPLHRLNTLTFGVLGMGAIGEATAKKARALGFTCIASDPRYTEGDVVEGVRIVGFRDLLGNSDVLSVHVPLTEGTFHMFDQAAFRSMKKGAVLVNTSRGAVIDTEALIESIDHGHIAGAGLDVFEEEVLPEDHPLTKIESVVLTPHAAWYSEESYSELKTRVAQNVMAFLQNGTQTNFIA